MDSQNRSSLISFFGSAADTIGHSLLSVRQASTRQLNKLAGASRNIGGHLEKVNEFYQSHRDIILVSSAVALTFFLTKKLSKKQVEEKPKNKKTVVSIHKTFISDQEDFDGPSMFTGKTAESSEREEVEKRCKEKILERLSSSEGEDEKIFFEMYKTYQNA